MSRLTVDNELLRSTIQKYLEKHQINHINQYHLLTMFKMLAKGDCTESDVNNELRKHYLRIKSSTPAMVLFNRVDNVMVFELHSTITNLVVLAFKINSVIKFVGVAESELSNDDVRNSFIHSGEVLRSRTKTTTLEKSLVDGVDFTYKKTIYEGYVEYTQVNMKFGEQEISYIEGN